MTQGELIRLLRQQKGLSLRALSDKVGLSHSQIVHLENDFDTHTGKAPRLSLEAFVNICNALDCDHMMFLEETGYIKKNTPTIKLVEVEDENETLLVDIYRALPNNLQRILIAQAQGIVDNYGIRVERRQARKMS